MTEQKNILFVGSYPPQFGGISSHLTSLIPDLNKEGYSATSLSPAGFDSENGGDLHRHIHINLKRFFLKNLFTVLFVSLRCLQNKKDLSWKDFLFSVSMATKIDELSKDKKWDHIFFYTWQNGYCIPNLKSILGYTPKIHFFMFGGLYEDPEKFRGVKGNIQAICDESDTLLSSSQYCADSLSRVLGISEEVRVIYVGVDIDLYHPTASGSSVREGLEIPQEAILISFFGRMNAEMGLDVVLNCAEQLLAENEEAYFLLAGAENDLSQEASELSRKNARVKFWKNVPHEEKPGIFAATDILLSPTKDLHACMGVSIKEAMACGIPVVASSSGGIPEAIDETDHSGYITSIIDGQVPEAEFKKKISLLISDATLRNTIGSSARVKAEKLFSTQGALEKYLKLFEEQ